MDPLYKYIDSLNTLVEIPQDGVLSRTIYADERIKAVIFGFDTGQELSEHTASMPAIIHIVSGDARLTFGGDSYEAHPGAWVHMQPNLSHSVYALTPTVMLLLLLKPPRQQPGAPPPERTEPRREPRVVAGEQGGQM
jgi:quercetin dioxygenase-like cupin family protein